MTPFEALVAHHRALFVAGQADAANRDPMEHAGINGCSLAPDAHLTSAERASYWLGFSERVRLAGRQAS